MTPAEVAAANAAIRAVRVAPNAPGMPRTSAKPASGIGTLVRNLFHKGKKKTEVQKGGKGSGHHGHKGIPGHRGGSLPRGAAAMQKPEAQPGEQPEDALNPPPPDWLLQEVDPNSLKNLHGGVNGDATYKAQTVGGHPVFLKVKAELARGSWRDNMPKKRDNEHEMAAQIINNAMGKPVLFPVGYIKGDVAGKGQTWVQDLFPGKNLEAVMGKRVKDFAPETVNGLGLFDAVIGNLDRHGMNLMVNGDQLAVVDHGLAFPTSNEKQWGNKKGIDARPKELTKIDMGRLDNLLNRRAEVDAALKPYLKQEQISAMWQRVDLMHRDSQLHYVQEEGVRWGPDRPRPAAPSLPGIDTGARDILGLPSRPAPPAQLPRMVPVFPGMARAAVGNIMHEVPLSPTAEAARFRRGPDLKPPRGGAFAPAAAIQNYEDWKRRHPRPSQEEGLAPTPVPAKPLPAFGKPRSFVPRTPQSLPKTPSARPFGKLRPSQAAFLRGRGHQLHLPLTRKIAQSRAIVNAIFKGGPGSGFHGHKGRPGEVGGSASDSEPHQGTPPEQGTLIPRTPEEQAIHDAKQLEEQVPDYLKEELDETTIFQLENENVSQTFTVETMSGKKVFIRPSSGLASESEVFREGVRNGADNQREMAAQIINNALGKMVDLPSLTLRDTPEGFGLVQDFRDHADTLYHKGLEWSDLEPKELSHMGLFDAIIGNVDRHGNNILLDRTGHAISIDHGLSFPNSNIGTGLDGNVEAMLRRPEKLTAGEVRQLSQFKAKRAVIDNAVKKYLQQPEIDAMWARVDMMEKFGQIVPAGNRAYVTGDPNKLRPSSIPFRRHGQTILEEIAAGIRTQGGRMRQSGAPYSGPPFS